MQKNVKTNQVLMNSQITARKMMVIHGETNLGMLDLNAALEYAEEHKLDLVQMNSDAIPVCKVFDFHKQRYENQKKAKAAKENAKTHVTKEITMRPVISQHDFDIKLRHIKEFVDQGMNVNVTVQFRNRELTTCADLGKSLLEKVIEDTRSNTVHPSAVSTTGRDMMVTIKVNK